MLTPILSRPYGANFSVNSGANSSFKKSKKPGANYFCTHCKVQGHSVDRCFKLHGYPAGFTGFKDKKAMVSASEVGQETPQNVGSTSEVTAPISMD